MRTKHILTVAALAGLAGCTGKYIRPTTQEKVPATPEAIARGNYLVNQVSACGVCHTPRPDGSWLAGERTDAFLSGGMVLTGDEKDFEFRAAAPNITPDVETGIGGWTDDQIMRAIRDGVDKNDELLMPIMPFPSFQRISDDDIRAIVAYLRTVPPVKNAVDRTKNDKGGFGFPMKMGLVHHEPARDVKAPARENKVEYGRYLATSVGPCHECHSLTSRGPSMDEGKFFKGSDLSVAEDGVGVVFARNLTPDPETGIGKYGAAQIKEALKNGKRLDGKPMAPPMAQLIPHTSGMTDEDLDAIAAFLLSLKPVKNKVPEPELTEASKKAMGL